MRWSDGKNLTSVGLAPGDVFLSEPYPGKLNIDCKLFTESALNDSMPTLHSLAGGAPGEGFDDIGEGFEKVAQRVQEAGSRTLTLLYWDRVDQFAHRFGVSAPETTGAVSELDKALKELANALAGKARVLVTADHGHLDVSKYVQLDEDHSLSKLLKCTQSGDDRFNYFHVRDGHVERFAEEFLSEFGEDSFLLSTDELIEMRLLGPEPPTPEVRERLGDFTSISRNASAFTWRAPDNLAGAQRSSHGGFSADEMMVPVLLA